MHPLVMLYTLQARALGRRLTRNLRSVKGAFLFVFGVAVIGLWITPSVWQAHRGPRTDPGVVRDLAPLILLTMAVMAVATSGGERAVTFTPAEVDFLFPGPFTRRQLLAYKIGKALAGVLFSSVLMSAVFLKHAAGWPQAWAAMFLALLFMQMFSMAVTLVAQAAGERAYTRTRKVVLGVVIAAVGVAAWPLIKDGGRPDFLEIARAVRGSPVGAVLIAPLDPFGRLFTATGWGAALAYAGLALAVNVALLWVVFFLDADYLEAAASRSQAVYERLQRVRQGGGLVAMATPGRRARGSVPQPPFLSGAGPIAWRQATTALRNARGLLLVVLVLGVALGPVMLSTGGRQSHTGAIVGLMAWMTLIVGAWLRFDFRGDLDQIDHLKSLPVSPVAVSAGQLLIPTLLMTACHLLIVASVLVVTRRADAALLAAAALCLPFNALLFAVENFIFLLFPTRAAATPADIQGYGRQILVLFAKGALVLAAGAVAGLLAMLAHFLTGSIAAAVATAAVALMAIAVGMVPAVAWAFNRFDVASDMPA